MCWTVQPFLYICYMLLLDALQPYVMIVGGARILDLLLKNAYHQAIRVSIIMLLAAFLISVLIAIVKHHAETISMKINRVCNAAGLYEVRFSGLCNFRREKESG
ncbi:MAG: hypothetical protein ACLTDX_06450 [[Clostridium] innocuum]